MKELCEVRAVPVQLEESNTIWVRTDIHGNAAKLFTVARIKQPPKILGETQGILYHEKYALNTY